MVESVDIEDLALDFTIPGYDIELRVSDSCFRVEVVTKIYSLGDETLPLPLRMSTSTSKRYSMLLLAKVLRYKQRPSAKDSPKFSRYQTYRRSQLMS